MPTSTYYPDAQAVDGYMGADGSGGVTWADIHGDGGIAAVDNDKLNLFLIGTHADTDKFTDLMRTIALFNGSADVSAQLVVISAVLTVFGKSKADTLGVAGDVNVYESSPASNTALVAGDFDSLGTTALSTAISWADFEVSGTLSRPNIFTFNAAGLAIVQTALRSDGIIKLGFRNANYDVADVEPTWSASKQNAIIVYSAQNVLSDARDPKLEVTFVSAQFPTNALTRVTGIIRRRSPGRDSIELLMGGLAPEPVTRFTFVPETAVPIEPPPPGELPLATGMIGPFTDPVSGAEYWVTIEGTIVYSSNPPLPTGAFDEVD